MVFCCNAQQQQESASSSDNDNDNVSWPSLLSIKQNSNGNGFNGNPFVALSSRSQRQTTSSNTNKSSSMSTAVEIICDQEFAQMSIKEREKGYNVLHCIPDIEEENAEEDYEKISIALLEFEKELESLIAKNNACQAYNLALKQSPSYVNNIEFKIQFLRADKYNPKAAAKRFTKFFEEKLRLFGVEKLTKNITLEDLSEDDIESLECGSMQICPIQDRAGRPIMVATETQKKYKSVDNYVRAQFYMLMSLLESMSTKAQIRGINMVGFIYATGAGAGGNKNMNNMNMNDMGIIWETAKCRYSLPIKIALGHVCLTDTRLKPLFEMANLPFLDTISKFACRYHFGTHLECLYALGGFGIPAMAIPDVNDIDNHIIWLQQRKHIEHARARKLEDAGNNHKRYSAASTSNASNSTASMTHSTTAGGIGMGIEEAAAAALLLNGDNDDDDDFALFDSSSSSLLEHVDQQQQQGDQGNSNNRMMSIDGGDGDGDGIIPLPLPLSGSNNQQHGQQQQQQHRFSFKLDLDIDVDPEDLNFMMQLEPDEDKYHEQANHHSLRSPEATAAANANAMPASSLPITDLAMGYGIDATSSRVAQQEQVPVPVPSKVPPSPPSTSPPRPRPQQYQSQRQRQLAAETTTTTTTTQVVSSSKGAIMNHKEGEGNASIGIVSFDDVNSTDVLLGRGKPLQKWSGNIAFRTLVSDRMDSYENANKSNKTKIATGVMHQIKSNGGRFLQQSSNQSCVGRPLSNETINTSCWEEITDHAARLKVAFTFRSLRKALKNKK